MGETINTLSVKMSDLSIKVDSLKDMFNTLQQNVMFNITTLLAILGFVLVASGWAMSILAKSWVEKSIQSKLTQMKQQLKDEISREVIKIADVAQLRFESSNFKLDVTFPNKYDYPPIVLIQPHDLVDVVVGEVTRTGFSIINTPKSKMDTLINTPVTISYIVISRG